MALNTNVDH